MAAWRADEHCNIDINNGAKHTMKNLIMALIATLLITATVSTAQARHYKHYRTQIDETGQVVSHPAGCPGRAFCGCGVSVKVFGHPVRNLFLASNWLRFPRATPGPGMVAARHGHVMYIESYDGNGNAVVYDPNSGNHQTRIHTRSLRGYVVVNPHSDRMASR